MKKHASKLGIYQNEYNISISFTDAQLAEIISLRKSGLEWEEVAKRFNKKNTPEKTLDAIKHAFRRYQNYFESDTQTISVKNLQEIAKTKKDNSRKAKENKALLEYMEEERELLERIEDLVSSAKLQKVALPKVSPAKDKKRMTIELNLSDIHYGKKTETFNLEVCRRRMRDLVAVTLKEIDRNKKHFNVERLIVSIIGDIIESETMHGIESSRSSEMSNMEQGQAAIESLFYDVILPLAQTGLPIDIPAVTGNHDRTEKEKTHVRRGRVHITWIIYNTLKLLCQAKGLTNVKFHISEGINVLLDIYGNPALYEHGDEAKNTTKDTLQKLLLKRSKQFQKIIKFFRLGHFHEFTMYGRGEIIINDSVPGPDGYSDNLGFDSMAGQTLVFYVETKTRPNCFYRVFPVYLK